MSNLTNQPYGRFGKQTEVVEHRAPLLPTTPLPNSAFSLTERKACAEIRIQAQSMNSYDNNSLVTSNDNSISHCLYYSIRNWGRQKTEADGIKPFAPGPFSAWARMQSAENTRNLKETQDDTRQCLSEPRKRPRRGKLDEEELKMKSNWIDFTHSCTEKTLDCGAWKMDTLK